MRVRSNGLNVFDNKLDYLTASIYNQVSDYLGYKSIEKLSTMVDQKVINRYGKMITISESYRSERIHILNNWVKKYDKKYEKRNKENGILSNVEYVFAIPSSTEEDGLTFAYVKSTSKLSLKLEDIITRSKYDNSNNSNSDNRQDSPVTITIYICGKKSNQYYKEITSQIEAIKDRLYVYNVSGSKRASRNEDGEIEEDFNSIVSDMNPRSMDTLFFDKGVKESIVTHINKFLANAPIYQQRNLLFKTGILFYGNPGTGKTSLANAISSYFNCSMIIIDINTFATLDINTLTHAINADNNRYVVLLEDIDTIFKTLDRKDDSELSQSDKKVINKLLQLLDSNSSPNNVIFIATTNHKEKLDEAILRDGRFDLKVEVGPVLEDAAIEMCKSFGLSDDKINKILTENTLPINQSKLQNLILQAIQSKKKSIIYEDGHAEVIEEDTPVSKVYNEVEAEDNSIHAEEKKEDTESDEEDMKLPEDDTDEEIDIPLFESCHKDDDEEECEDDTDDQEKLTESTINDICEMIDYAMTGKREGEEEEEEEEEPKPTFNTYNNFMKDLANKMLDSEDATDSSREKYGRFYSVLKSIFSTDYRLIEDGKISTADLQKAYDRFSKNDDMIMGKEASTHYFPLSEGSKKHMSINDLYNQMQKESMSSHSNDNTSALNDKE